ncbi:MAG: GAF domain-containing protein [Burkholderiales bacterium]|nr:GAF domain-containing protein [Burkholderiales bacterium]
MPNRLPIALDAIRECLDGTIPAQLATCAPDGTPNVTYVSEVHFVDGQHVALSFQFFNKTRENILAHPRATALVNHPDTAARYRIGLHYLRTETAGPVFESMKAKLAGIASHTGMSGVFRLRGADIYRVLDIEHVPGIELPTRPANRNLLAAIRVCSQRVTASVDLASLFEAVLDGLESLCDIHHAMILMLAEQGDRLYTVASRGYAQSGVGSEIPLGAGVIGVAARERTPIRITYLTNEYAYSRAVRASMGADELAAKLETEIPLPGLAEPRSQLAVPIFGGSRLLGVLYVESPENRRFGYDDEDALVAVAAQVGTAIGALAQAAEHSEPANPHAGRTPVSGAQVTIRRYAENDSVFIGDDYLIKGVAGAIFWKLLRDYVYESRTEFTNRELRVDPAIRLPDVSENLEARLILLQRRLAERCDFVRIEKTGRGRFRLCVGRPVKLVEVAGAAAR